MHSVTASLPAQADLIRVAVGAWVAFGVFIAASWLAAIIWVWRDIHSRTEDLFVRVASLVPVAMFSIAGLLPYALLRPQETTDERLQRQLDTETCRRELDQYTVCTRCQRRTQVDFIACPYCRETLSRACDGCGKQVTLTWLLCPYCAQPQPQVSRPAVRRREPCPAPARTPATRPQVTVR